ncbi:hypothetical protein A3709_20585 [Halioglobus sp. HI00S01]|uniref:hypothetical protein n=1 Tax=Halioglobus sp. HI00S01 TaxID=1822214 RepID=UPI0007C28E7F|nr:hypothetical protein [Halioglobus sp. HI00S01]KZX58011.1 hypothetical protein A3709_20585 [Halioglobus sp. HI00S01]
MGNFTGVIRRFLAIATAASVFGCGIAVAQEDAIDGAAIENAEPSATASSPKREKGLGHKILRTLGVTGPKPNEEGRSVCLGGYRYIYSTEGKIVLTGEGAARLRDRMNIVPVKENEALRVFGEDRQAIIEDVTQIDAAKAGKRIQSNRVVGTLEAGPAKASIEKALPEASIQWDAVPAALADPRTIYASDVFDFLAQALAGQRLVISEGPQQGRYRVTEPK